mmetsp:Transcript_51143/g.123034  ORF Transcript_51143/g.123034 Transcript_51143/m.123034 type:complete len:228 (-) Transcript_51143:831-1514(-)
MSAARRSLLHVLQQLLRQRPELPARVRHQAQGHTHAKSLVEEVPHPDNFQGVQAQLMQRLALNPLPAAAALRVLQQKVFHGLPGVEAAADCRGHSGLRGRCGRGAEVVPEELQEREVAPLAVRPVHVAGAELCGCRLCLRDHTQGCREAGQRGGGGQRRVAVLQSLLVRLRPHLRHAGLSPGAPVDGHHAARRLVTLWQSTHSTEGGQLIKQGVGCTVVDLAGVAEE